jgi:hypothetical protein
MRDVGWRVGKSLRAIPARGTPCRGSHPGGCGVDAELGEEPMYSTFDDYELSVDGFACSLATPDHEIAMTSL